MSTEQYGTVQNVPSTEVCLAYTLSIDSLPLLVFVLTSNLLGVDMEYVYTHRDLVLTTLFIP